MTSAVYLSDQEYFRNPGLLVYNQSIIQKINLYLLARCSFDKSATSSDIRLDYILSKSTDVALKFGIVIKDGTPVFKGDAPTTNVEAGQQKCANFFCWSCPPKATSSSNIISTCLCTIQVN